MIATLIISITTFVLVILSILLFPKITIKDFSISTYWIIALLGAIILLATSLAPINEVFSQLTSNNSINPLKILVLFFSMTLLSIFLDEFGLFKYLASYASKRSSGSQIRLFFLLYLLTSLLTIFTSNDVVILTLTPFICFFCKRSRINPIPYLVMEFAAANTWSLMFVIGNPTNIYLATSAGINFISYFKVMAVPTICAGIIELLILYLIFRKRLSNPIIICEEEYQIENKTVLIVGLIHLIICLIFLVITSYIDIEMYLISAICAGSLLIFTIIYCLFNKQYWRYVLSTLKRLPYPLIPFFLSMTIIVVGMNYQGITSEISSLLGNTNSLWVYGYSSFMSSNLINNIPMSILYSNLISNLTNQAFIDATYASIIGSNIGAFLTPIGALAGIMFTGLVNEHGIRYTFIDFVKYGVIISLPVMTIALTMTGVMLNSF